MKCLPEVRKMLLLYKELVHHGVLVGLSRIAYGTRKVAL